MPRWMRRLMNVLLLPLAVLMVVLEDVVWAGVVALLRALHRAPPVAALEVALGRLSGPAALPLFLVPEAVGFAGKLWALALLAKGHPLAALEAYVGIRLVCTVIAVFIYRACEAALLRIGWFARAVGWVHAARDWAMGLVRPALDGVRRWLRRGRGRLALRLFALKRYLRGRG